MHEAGRRSSTPARSGRGCERPPRLAAQRRHEVPSRTRANRDEALGMAQDDARLLGADGTAEDVVVAALVALVVRPLGQLLRPRGTAEPARALPYHEAEHDAQRLGAVVHRGGIPMACSRPSSTEWATRVPAHA